MMLSQKRGSADFGPTHILKAIAFAADKHRRQRRKDAEASPYINHPIAVATVLASEGDVSDEPTFYTIPSRIPKPPSWSLRNTSDPRWLVLCAS
jgi:hypothetical protein